MITRFPPRGGRTRPAVRRLLSATAVTTLAPLAAQAEDAATTLPRLQVEAPATASRTAPDAATRTAELEARLPGSFAVLPAAAFENSRAFTLGDMIATVPGVYAQSRFGQSETKLSIRGSGLSRNFHMRGVKLSLDGLPINTNDGAGDFQQIDPLTLRQVEVLKGANAMSDGVSMLGGEVRMESRTGLSDPGVTARAETGSFGFVRTHAGFGVAEGRMDAHLSATLNREDGFRAHSAHDNKTFAGNLGWRVSDTVETRLYLGYDDLWQELPSALTLDQALNRPRSTAAGNITGDQRRDISSVRLANRWSISLGEATELELGGWVLDKSLYHPIFQVLDHDYLDGGVQAKLSTATQLAGMSHGLTFGVRLAGGETDARRYVNIGGSRGALTAEGTERGRTYEAWAEDAIGLTPALTLVLGLQAMHATRGYDDAFLSDGDDSGEARYDELNPRLGLIWQGAPDWQLYGNLSRSAEPPTLSEVNPSTAPGFADIDAQTAWTLEIGSRGHIGRLGFDVAVFESRIRDELQTFGTITGGTTTINADRTIHRGLEAGFDLTLTEALALKASYTWSDFRFDGDPTYGDNALPGVPPHRIYAELRWQPVQGAWIAPNVEWVPVDYAVDNAESLDAPGYTLLGIRAGWEPVAGVTLFLDGRNLTDENYIATTSVAPTADANAALFYPGNGAAIYGGISYRF
ncbi:MAG: TonB-dependent receptor protein [Tistrella sp.]|nr:TonB-dependent receptor protein [Tistrella sp.]